MNEVQMVRTDMMVATDRIYRSRLQEARSNQRLTREARGQRHPTLHDVLTRLRMVVGKELTLAS